MEPDGRSLGDLAIRRKNDAIFVAAPFQKTKAPAKKVAFFAGA
jgi:hypothetical protein